MLILRQPQTETLSTHVDIAPAGDVDGVATLNQQGQR